MITYCFYISIFIVSSSYGATYAYDGVHRSATATGFVIDLCFLSLICLCRFPWYATATSTATVTVTLTAPKGIRRSAFGSGSGSLYPVI
jgi:hypothetical protein